ncbi:MAG: HprK-related kinase A [Aquabacterium sp.]|uniref:HprK-related kinase A n=1 Tax=Aquabacterium sp. TaxID=1872578 RepID=UPI002A36DED5|nr:HprK-related kinase A [Aquabacterium sp.]MDX9843492.1 HprK-related kinase A [Aquabacterium sp.]
MTPHLVGALPLDTLSAALCTSGLYLRMDPFVVHVRSAIPIVADGIQRMYAAHTCWTEDGQFADFHVAVRRKWRPSRPLCVFEMDGHGPFTPLAYGEAYAFLEWGLNWCITSFCHNWITLHSAVLERDGRAVILPAPPGSGKSTLCAALMLDGWRLLSDEMALLDPRTGLLTASPRPISLKNASIDLMRRRAPDVVMGPVALDTLKGTVCHMQVSADSTARARELATPAWIIFPRYEAGAPLTLNPRPKADALLNLHRNSFNHHVHGRQGFETLADVVERCDVYDLRYSDLDEALACFARLSA